MEELSVKALDSSWATQAAPADVSVLLPATPDYRKLEVIYRGSVLVLVSRRTSRSGGIAPSFGEVWQLYVISGPDKVAEHLSGVKGSIHTNRHISVRCEETATLLGSDIRVQVMVPESMTDPRDPPPTFLIHVEGEIS